MDLFQDQVTNISLPLAELSIQRLYSNKDGDKILEWLKNNLTWEQQYIFIYGSQVPLPRLTAWYAEKNYTYSGITSKLNSWIPELIRIRERVEKVTGYTYNGVFLNWYRDGKDSIDWHADDEPELGNNPVIASVSLGSTRTFHFRNKYNKKDKYSIDLYHGSCLLMEGVTQHHWEHKISKTNKDVSDRINLTFRTVYG